MIIETNTTEQETQAYVEYLENKYGKKIEELKVVVDGEYVTTKDTEINNSKTYYTQYAFDLWKYDCDTALGIKC